MARIVRRRRRIIRRRIVRRRVLPKKTLRRVVKQQIMRNEETKYNATQLCLNRTIDPAIHTPGQDCFPLVPKIPQGNDYYQRNGRKVMPTRCKVDVSLAFSQPNPGQTPPAFSQYAQQIYVVIYLLKSKAEDNWFRFAQSTDYMGLLDNGDGTYAPFGELVTPPAPASTFWTADTSFLQRPIDNTEFTLLQRKVVKLTKNVGNIDTGVAGNSQVPNLPTSSWSGSFYYKLPTLNYDDSTTGVTLNGGYPTNTNVFMAVGWCYADNNGTYYTDATVSTQMPPDQIVSVTARSHVWYKDA